MNLAAATVLVLTAALATLLTRRAKPVSRRHVQIAALLNAVGAITALASSGKVAALSAIFVLTVAPTTLTLAVYGKFVRETAVLTTAVALGAAVAAAIAAILLEQPALAFVPLLANVIALAALSLAHFRIDRRASALVLAAAVSLAAGASASLEGGFAAYAPFAAAGLMGIALLVASPSGVGVEQKRRWRSRALAVRRKR